MTQRLCTDSYKTNTIISSVPEKTTLKHHHHHYLSVPSSLRKNRNNRNCLSRNRNCCSVSASYSAPKAVVEEEISGRLGTMATTVSYNWMEFAKNVSGEWDGHGADFTIEGKPIELPESVVPEAYREWEVRVFDWQTQCPTLAQTEDYSLFYKTIKLLPTVGCEADAATRYTIDERIIGGENSLVSAFAYNSSGCYVAVWPIKDHSAHKILELEHCLVDPQNRESRVRIVQVVRVENNRITLQNIKMFSEQWYGPFRNGDQLGGCSLRDSSFAKTDALKSSEVVGVWQGLHAVVCLDNSQNIHEELQDDNVRKSVRDENGLILLPKQLWCSLKEREDGETCCEVGWLLEQGSAITSKCIYSPDTGLKEITVARETAATS